MLHILSSIGIGHHQRNQVEINDMNRRLMPNLISVKNLESLEVFI